MLEASLFICATKHLGNYILVRIFYNCTMTAFMLSYSTAVASVFKLTMLVDGVSTIKCAVE